MDDLTLISKKYKTDKSTAHNYTVVYDKYFSEFRKSEINLLEIGIGVYDDKFGGGGSLQMWREYFEKATIYGLDIIEKKIDLGERIKIYQGSQSNINDLKTLINDAKKFKIIIDDGSHLNKDQIKSFKILFEYLEEGGLYVIEDVQTSYHLRDGGDGFYLKNEKTAINYFKSIIDKINYAEIENPFFNFSNDYFARNITDIHFYHNLIIIRKNNNNEKSNLLSDYQFKAKGKTFVGLRANVKKIRYLLHFFRWKYNKFLDLLKL